MSRPDNISRGSISLRPLRDEQSDYELYALWRNQPHVRQWWDPDDPPHTPEAALAELRPGVLGESADRFAFIEYEGTPVGFIQYYPWRAYQEELDGLGLTLPEGAWGMDIFIGELSQISRGIGSATVRLLADHLCAEEGASALAFGVDRNNHRARRAYEKAGLTPTVDFLDSDTRNGRRVSSVLMVRSCE